MEGAAPWNDVSLFSASLFADLWVTGPGPYGGNEVERHGHVATDVIVAPFRALADGRNEK